MKVKEMSSIGKNFYQLACILSLGAVWISKLVIQKAIIDALEDK